MKIDIDDVIGGEYSVLATNSELCIVIEGLNELKKIKRCASVTAAASGLVEADFGVDQIEHLIKVLESQVETSSVFQLQFREFEHFRGGPENIKLYFRAFTTDEHEAGPSFAVVEVLGPFFESEFWRKLVCLRETLMGNLLCVSQLRVYDEPDQWERAEFAGDPHLCCAELVMSQHGFWFADTLKHAGEHWETEQVSLQFLATSVSRFVERKVFLSDEIEVDAVTKFDALRAKEAASLAQDTTLTSKVGESS
jgi:hypothetical protein